MIDCAKFFPTRYKEVDLDQKKVIPPPPQHCLTSTVFVCFAKTEQIRPATAADASSCSVRALEYAPLY